MQRYEKRVIKVKRPYKLLYVFDRERNEELYFIEKGKYGNEGRWSAKTLPEITAIWFSLNPEQSVLDFNNTGSCLYDRML